MFHANEPGQNVRGGNQNMAQMQRESNGSCAIRTLYLTGLSSGFTTVNFNFHESLLSTGSGGDKGGVQDIAAVRKFMSISLLEFLHLCFSGCADTTTVRKIKKPSLRSQQRNCAKKKLFKI